MRLAYFPGCTVKAQAPQFEASALAVARALGVELVEPANWQCCGAVYPLAADNLLPLASPYRTLMAAAKAGLDVTTLCSACHNVLKRTAHRLQTDAEVRAKLEAFTEEPWQPVRVRHLLEVIRDEFGWEALAGRAQRRLSLRLAPYYGCLLLRPAEVMAFDDPERPRVLHQLCAALGAEPVSSPYEAECCGAFLTLADARASLAAARNIIAAARGRGAQAIVTSCPLCHFNLDARQAELAADGQPLPVLYFTQVLAQALGLSDDCCQFELHYADPAPCFAGASGGGNG